MRDQAADTAARRAALSHHAATTAGESSPHASSGPHLGGLGPKPEDPRFFAASRRLSSSVHAEALGREELLGEGPQAALERDVPRVAVERGGGPLAGHWNKVLSVRAGVAEHRPGERRVRHGEAADLFRPVEREKRPLDRVEERRERRGARRGGGLGPAQQLALHGPRVDGVGGDALGVQSRVQLLREEQVGEL
eukprot:CAMPEP_0202787190 /NCGR_PEP_ID=MMETSP1388-20130828/71846_1 /ASSEMBLY_ACC=CAM_ASM_000864 /TAXON_ID=37098 /ORGANISM="Isochrysis sp, Strain CCMP1244" /LENGTH=193 /DNA_ID=CAMNT_0049456771 /DNA_START=28 /DNA_END=606 /DNA_ORIENTATION=-